MPYGILIHVNAEKSSNGSKGQNEMKARFSDQTSVRDGIVERSIVSVSDSLCGIDFHIMSDEDVSRIHFSLDFEQVNALRDAIAEHDARVAAEHGSQIWTNGGKHYDSDERYGHRA